MAMTDSLSSAFTGRVVAVNAKGLRLDGHESWYNVSKFAPGVVLPERGETVTVSVDSKGFLRSCEIAAAAPDANGVAPIRGGSGTPERSVSQKDRTISRLAILKAAAEFGASRPELKSGDVLTIAAFWERWVNRGDDEDLTDAF